MTPAPSAEDLRALSWLRKEVQRSVDAAQKAVQRHLREALALRGAEGGAVDPAVLRAARDHLHQAAGALELAGQTEAALLVRAGEQAVHRMVQQPELATGELSLCIERAGFALNDYLARLTQGKPAHSVGLFQPYRALLAFTGNPRVHPADLWRHDWRWRVIAAEADAPALPPDDSAPEAMERLILRLMRAPDRATLHRMSDLCAALGAQAKGRRATMWRLAAAFFEAQAFGLIKSDVYVKRAASRLLAQVRQGLKPGEVSDQLARDLLFFCACAIEADDDEETPRLAAVRTAYGLPPGDLPDYELPSLGRTDPAWLALARKRLTAAREAWSSAVAGEAAREGILAASFAVLQESLEKLFPNGAVLGQALVRAAELQRTSTAVQPALALEVATAILVLEASLDDGELQTQEDMTRQVQRLAERIDAAGQGGAPQPLEAWMEAVYRRVSDNQTLRNVVVELRATLGDVERSIDAFFKTPQRRELLLPVDAQLGSMRGVLSVLGLDEATQALQRMRDDVAALSGSLLDAQRQTLFDRLADNLGALGFSVDILGVQPDLARTMFRFDAATGRLVAPLPPPAAQQVLAEAVVDSVPDGLVSNANVPVLLAAEALVAEPPTPLPVLAEEMLPEAPQPPAVQAVAPTAVDVGTGSPTDQQADHRDTDRAEMLAVFLEESAEVFQQARGALQQLDNSARDPSDDVGPMTAVRRAFHTLKGSSRMVGLQDFGEAAWACEQLYNARLAQSAAMSPALRSLTQQALDYLQSWVQAIGAGTASAHEPQAVVAAAEALRLRDELRPIALPQSQPEAAEHIKVIGPLRVEIAMFNIFLNEADELSRQLSTSLAEWAVEPQGPPGETVEALAHSLAGNSAAVGHTELATLARSLEYAVGRSNEVACVSAGEAALYNEAAGDLQRLLHQFAAGFLEAPAPGLVARLDNHMPVARPPAEDMEPAPAEAPAEREAEMEAVAQPVLPAEAPVLEVPAPVQEAAPPADPPVLRRVLDGDDDVDAIDAVDDELFSNFREEAEDLLPQLQSQLRQWQSQPQDRASAAACMRTLHTFKGAARLVGAMRQGELAHRLESAVQTVLDRPALSLEHIESLSWRVDALEAEFVSLRERVQAASAGTQPLDAATDRPAPVTATVEPLAPAEMPVALPTPLVSAPDAALNWVPAAAGVSTAAAGLLLAADARAPVSIDWARFADEAASWPRDEQAAVPVSLGAVRVKAALLDRLVNQTGETSMARARLEADLSQVKSSLADLTDNLERLRRQLRDVEVQAESQIASRLEAVKAASADFDPLEMDRYTRIQELTRMMAESVNDVATVQRGLQRALQSGEDQVAMQGRLLRSMQEDLMRTRMVEFESLADRLYRVVRQGAKDTGKQVRLDILGGSIELDRGVLERMTAPFEHLLRNSLAHGIEEPARRLAAGKNATGLIEIILLPEGNEVSIELRDDGAGLDLPLIRERARALGLVPPEAAIADEEAAMLIFASGVSTADRVSEIAGRGVGMDVVRSEVQALGGRIELNTTPGRGTSFRMVLPLTTAVTQVLMLRTGDLMVAVPANLIELVRSETPATVENAYRQGYVMVGDEATAFFGLASLLGGEPVSTGLSDVTPVVIVRSAAQRVAVHVDEVAGNQEVVVKNLGPQLARLPGLAGMTLLPSGLVTAIYNPVALAARYGNESRRRVQALLDHCAPGTPLVVQRPQAAKAPLVLVVDDSLTVRRVTQRLLLREGYRVSLAKDGQDALDRLAEERPAVVLSDIEMPRMDGFELTRRLRANPAWFDLPVIMITSRIAQKHRDLARELGVQHYLGKPYGEEDLLSVVAAHTQGSARMQLEQRPDAAA
jgi:chemosensory pili system protein ChpA (sensor histidine kinase/response regulator)